MCFRTHRHTHIRPPRTHLHTNTYMYLQAFPLAIPAMCGERAGRQAGNRYSMHFFTRVCMQTDQTGERDRASLGQTAARRKSDRKSTHSNRLAGPPRARPRLCARDRWSERAGSCSSVEVLSSRFCVHSRFECNLSPFVCPRRQHRHKHASLDGLPLLPWMVCKQPRVRKRTAAPCAASRERDTKKVLRHCFLLT